MIKRMLAIAALGVPLVGGAVTAAHASSVPAPAAIHSTQVATDAGDTTADADANAPCTGQGTAAEAGNCVDSQNTAGPADNTADTGEAAASGPDTDSIQTGP